MKDRFSVYRYPAEYASAHDELPLYRTSMKENIACKTAIENAINKHYHNNILDTKAVADEVVAQFGMERVVFVLANTVQRKSWDARFSPANKAWASGIVVFELSGALDYDNRLKFIVDKCHPGLTDLFITHIRKVEAQQKTGGAV